MISAVRLIKVVFLVPAMLILLLTAACGTPEFAETYPVSGSVVLPDGTPMQGGKIEFESVTDATMRAMGDIEPDGTFETVFTYKPNGREVEGLIAGEHRIRLELPAGNDEPGSASQARKPPLVDARYRNFDTSNLKCTVPMPDNKLTIKLEKASR